MYRHILVPTDGSRLAAKGIKAAVKLARALGARVTGVYAIPPWVPPVYGEAAIYVPALSEQEYRRSTEKSAHKALAVVAVEAKAAGVRCETRAVRADQAWQGIVRTARSRKCDLVAIASHGRGALGGLILGSVTSRVLAHSKIPVLVLR